MKRLRKSTKPLLPGVIEKLYTRSIHERWDYYDLIQALLKHGINYPKLFECMKIRTIGAIKVAIQRLLKHLKSYKKSDLSEQ